jgi:hypothetical protein
MPMANSVARFLTMLAVLGLSLAGGAYAHGDLQPPHVHAVEENHLSTHDHSQLEIECCDAGAGEVVHCGANLLAITGKLDLLLPQSGSLGQIEISHPRHGINQAVEPPPPRPRTA